MELTSSDSLCEKVNRVLKNFKMAYPEDQKKVEKDEIGFDLA
jgi:hypothetical protein